MKPEETMKELLQSAAIMRRVSAMRTEANAEEKTAAAFDTMQAMRGSATKANEAATELRNAARRMYNTLDNSQEWGSRTAGNWEDYAENARTRAAQAQELTALFSSLGNAALESAQYSERPEDKHGWESQATSELATSGAWAGAAQAWTGAGAAWDSAAASRKVAEEYGNGE